jgi:hypothetical protein
MKKKNQCYNGREVKVRNNTESNQKARWEKDIHSLKLCNVQWVVNNVNSYTLGSLQGEKENQIIHKLRPTQANREYGPQYRIQGTSEEGTAILPRQYKTVLVIRIRSDPKLLAGSGFGKNHYLRIRPALDPK